MRRFTEYQSFEDLEKHEAGNFLPKFSNRESLVLIIASHAGRIEPYTGIIARKIAGDDLSLYQFLGLRKRFRTDPGHGRKQSLHLSSTRFKEPTAVKAVRTCECAVSVHGLSNSVADKFKGLDIYVGGMNSGLRKKIVNALKAAAFKAVDCTDLSAFPHKGQEASNIVNLCKRKAGGVQLEITNRERQRLYRHSKRMAGFCSAIRKILDSI